MQSLCVNTHIQREKKLGQVVDNQENEELVEKGVQICTL